MKSLIALALILASGCAHKLADPKKGRAPPSGTGSVGFLASRREPEGGVAGIEVGQEAPRIAEPKIRRLARRRGAARAEERVVRALAGVLGAGGGAAEPRVGDFTRKGPHVARELGMSERSLQRHLREVGSSFNALADEVRKATAWLYLEQPDLALAEIGFLLGFADQSTFNRAFKRWTGLTPKQARLQALRAKPAGAGA